MRPGCVLLVAVMMVAACGGAGVKPTTSQCTGDNADPDACLAVVNDKLAGKDEAGAREYVEKLVLSVSTAPACLRDHEAPGCFAGVVALLREHPIGLLAEYDLSDDILNMVPRWTGSEETGPRMQARLALHGMCVVPGKNPVAQQRACIVLGDLVADERMKRCGPECDASDPQKIPGWSTKDVIDGYAAACKVDTSRVPADVYAVFADLIAKTYKVSGGKPVCGIKASPERGASIPDALANADRIRTDMRAREASAISAAKRETERMKAMEKSKVEAAARAAAAEEAAFRKDIIEAIHRSDWPTTFGLLTKRRGSSVDNTVATAINGIWDPFTEWAIGQNGVSAAYLDLSSRLALGPKNHAIRVSLATFRDRALVEAKKTGKLARGVGGVWLRAAVAARIAGPTGPDEQAAATAAWGKLVGSARTSLQVEALAPACAPLIRASAAGGRTVKAKSTLQCTLEPERSFTAKEPFKVKQHVVGAEGEKDIDQETMVDVNHRTYKVVVHGVLAVYAGAPRQAVPIDFDEIVDDIDGSDTRKFDVALAAAKDMITKATVSAIESADATKAYAAGLAAVKNGRKEAAENQLVIHGVLAGSSPELDELMTGYGVSFGELLPQ